MQISRRAFLQYCMASAGSLGLSASVLGRLEEAAAQNAALPNVIWLSGAACTGCTVSLANLFSTAQPTDIADLLISHINLAYHSTLMAGAGDLAVQNMRSAANGSYILVVEGGIPTAFGGYTCVLWTENGTEVTALSAVRALAPRALAVLAVGTCASFGGIPGGQPNPTGVVSVRSATGVNAINIAGCPAHPDWIVWTIANLLAGTVPRLDSQGRPAALYGSGEDSSIHERCPREETEEASTFGVEGRCLRELGCKGPQTSADCPSRKWNSATNWCIGANSICLGCTEQGFPDRLSPFYRNTASRACTGFCVTKAKWQR